MTQNIHTIIFISGICALALALLFMPDMPLPAPSTSGPASIGISHPVITPPAEQENKEPEKTKAEESNTTLEKQKTAPEEVLGTPSTELKAANDERVLTSEPPPPIRLSSQTLYTIAFERVVNLFCELGNDEVAIATGVIIHENGYILTNAHVADSEKANSCLIRRGSPARNFAIAKRVFSPPGFSSKNYERENLARDIAIWKITEVLEDESSATFPSLAIQPAHLPVDGNPLSTFSYPAELLGSPTIINSLYLSFSETQVVSHDAYFIESMQSLGSQRGASGGILLDPFTGEFAGLIFAINDAKKESIQERTLFSLTPFAINEAVRTTTGKDLEAYLDTNP